MMYCEKHRKSMPIDECPVCVREERDRLRYILAENDGCYAAWDEATEDAKHLAEERDRYRKALEEIVAAVEAVRPTSHTWGIATKALEGKA